MAAMIELSADTQASYLALFQTHTPRPIHSAAELDAMIALIDSFLDRPYLTQAEEDFLELLSELVESYENAHVELPAVIGVEALRHLMEANDLKQSDLAELFGGKSVVSEVLSGKRALSKQHIRGLSARFGLPADVFLA